MAEAGGVRSFAALRAALARPGLWSAVWLAQCLLALAPAVLFANWLAPELANRVAPYALFADLGSAFRTDHREKLNQIDASIGQLGALLVVAAVVLGAFTAGAWLSAFLAPQRTRGATALAAGGARFFGRFLRLVLLTGLLLALWTWLVQGPAWNQLVLRGLAGVPVGDFERLETLRNEDTALLLKQLREGLYALGVALVLVWGDFTRTRLALFDTRSASWAGLQSAGLLARHPLRALRPVLVLFLIEALIVLGLGLGAARIEAGLGSLGHVIALFLLAQLALLWRILLRGARYHAIVGVTRELATPPAAPDPWEAARPVPRPWTR